MPTELRWDEWATQGVRRIAQHEIAAALKTLDRRAVSNQSVHAARKAIKKARAALRLLRDAIGDRTYRRENTALRNASRPLSADRDAQTLIDTLDMLVKYYGTRASTLPLQKFRHSLRRNRSDVQRRLLKQADGLKSSRDALGATHERAARWSVGRHGWSVLGAGLKRVYSAGRRAFDRALSERSVEHLHEWRKQVKYLWNQLQIFEPMSPKYIGELTNRTHALAENLGDDHDLAHLRATVLASSNASLSSTTQSTLIALIDRSRVRLEVKVLVLGRRLYRDPPIVFMARFRSYWRGWHRKAPTSRLSRDA
jgi:CHAD domain-containing protein